MPREAALLGCIVIVGCFGSAKGDDVPIPQRFKLDDLRVENVATAIRAALNEYDHLQPLFENYRRWIFAQKEQFRYEVEQLPALFNHAPQPSTFDHAALDAAWVAQQHELHELRSGLSRAGVFEAMCIQTLRFRKSGWQYLIGKSMTWLRKRGQK